MKKFVITFFLVFCASLAFSQARKPSIMVVPSDVWCHTSNYMMEFENQGQIIRLPDYRKALQENSDLLLVISKINELMADRGFPLKNLESSLRSLERQAAEDAMLTSRGGGEITESPIDALKAVAQADIWLQMTWTVNTQGPKKSVTFNLQGLDAYTDKQVAGASGTGNPSFTAELPVLLEESVLSHLDNFNFQLQNHFDNMFEEGREVALRVRVWDTWGMDLYDNFEGVELSEIIEEWMYDNCVQGRFSTSIATQNQLLFEQVRIPLFNERGRAVDTRGWARGLQRYLRENYDIESTLMMRGLGQAQLVLGER